MPKSFKKTSFILMIAFFLMQNKPAYSADACLPGAVFVSGEYLSEEQGAKYGDLSKASYSYNVNVNYPTGSTYRKISPDGNSVNFGFDINVDTTIFTKIYTNFLSILPGFLPYNDVDLPTSISSNPELKAKWDRYYCLSGLDDTQTGTITVPSVGGTVRYRYEENKPRSSNEPIVVEGPGGVPIATTRPVTRDNWQPKDGSQPFNFTSDTADVDVPYPNGLRELARKVATMIKDQYCSVGQANACLGGYTCKSFEQLNTDPAVYANDTNAVGKNGFCVVDNQQLASLETSERFSKILCTPLVSNTAVGTVPSNFCYAANHSNTLTQTTAATNTDPGGGAPTTWPYLNDANISEPTNSLAFDLDLFTNKGEISNVDCLNNNPKNCNLDGYFRGAFVNKLSTYQTDEERRWYDEVPSVFGATFDPKNSRREEGPIARDVIDKMGTYYEISNEARMFDPRLLSSGFGVQITDAGDRAYLRAVNDDQKGILFVNDRPIGALKLNDGSSVPAQSFPSIARQISGPVVSAMTIANSRAYITVSTDGGANFTKLIPVKDGPGHLRVPSPYSEVGLLVNSVGQTIMFLKSADRNGAMGYVVYTPDNPRTQGDDSSFSAFNPIGDEDNLGTDTAVAIDEQNNIHMVGLNQYGGFNYANLTFSGGGYTQSATYPLKVTPAGVTGAEYSRSGYRNRPNTVQAYCGANGCVAHIAVVAGLPNNDRDSISIIYTAVNLAGQVVSPPEVVTSRDKDYDSGILKQARTGPDRAWVSYSLGDNTAFHGTGSSIAVIGGVPHVLYKMSIYDHPNGYENVGFHQMFVARTTPTGWFSGMPVSGRISRALDGNPGFGGFTLGNVSRNGVFAFTVIDQLTKYDPAGKYFDAAGYKQCLPNTPINLIGSGRDDFNANLCGGTKGKKYVIPPTKANAKMEFVDTPDMENL